jgi:hypothetical protein
VIYNLSLGERAFVYQATENRIDEDEKAQKRAERKSRKGGK